MRKILASGVMILLLLILFLGCTSHPKPTSEGSVTNPVVLTVGEPHEGSVSSFGTSFYKFTVNTNGNHTIALTNTQSDLSWELYSNPDFLSGFIWYCDDWWVAADEIYTVVLTAGNTYYLLVDEWDYVAGTYTLLVTGP